MRVTIQILLTAALAVVAYVHADLAGSYDGITAAVSQGTLFRAEAAAASLAALLVLMAGRRLTYGFAFLVAASALGAILLYRYVNVGTLGPLPDMYEPAWTPEKAAAAAAAAAAVALSLAAIALRPGKRAPAPHGPGLIRRALRLRQRTEGSS